MTCGSWQRWIGSATRKPGSASISRGSGRTFRAPARSFRARSRGTSRMKPAAGVSCLPNHDPLVLAQRIAQLDQMARGRFYWGVGSGGFPGDFELFGVDPKTGEHRGITREILDTVLALWQDAKPGGYEG